MLAAVLSLTQMVAQNTVVTVGTGTLSENAGAIPGLWGNHRSMQLFTVSEMNSPNGGVIESIGLELASVATGTNTGRTLRIYMKEVPDTTVASQQVVSNLTQGATLVYSSTDLTCTADTWNDFTLDTPFPYSGTGSLCVIFEGEGCTTSGGCGVSVKYTYGTNKGYTYTWDGTSAAPTTPTSARNTHRFNTRFSIAPLPEDYCYPPSNLSLSNVTASQAVLSWESDASSTTFALEYKTVTDEDWTEASNNINGNSYTLTGLTSNTEYSVRLHAVCSEENNSTNVSCSFRTTCYDAAISQYPYEDGFEDGIDCYTSSASSNYSWVVESTGSNPSCNPHSGTKMLKYQSYSATRGEWATLISPAFDIAGNMEVSFYFYNSTDGSSSSMDRVLVYMNNTPSLEGATLLDSVMRYGSENAWNEFYFPIPTGTTGTKYVILKAVSGYGHNMYLDDFKVYQVSCARPTDLAVSNISTTSAEISWNGVADSYTVKYKAEDGEEWSEESATSSPAVISSLESGTKYFVTVQATCAGQPSLEPQAVFFYTFCEAISELPWVESFDNAFITQTNGYETPECWTNIHEGSVANNKWQSATGSSAHSGSGALWWNGSTSTSNTYNDWMISPAIEFTGSQSLKFKIKPNSGTYNTEFQILYLDEAAYPFTGTVEDTINFVSFDTVCFAGNAYTDYEVLFPSELSGTGRFAFRVNTPSADFYIDSLVVSEAPDCPDVYGFAVNAIGSNSVLANIRTSNSNGSGWKIVYSQAGSPSEFDPEAASEYIEVSSADEFPYTISGLEAGAAYCFAVQQNCGGAFSEVISVTMPNITVNMPYYQSFDNGDDLSEWQIISNGINVWNYGTATNNTLGEDGTPNTGGALYISDDNGATNHYSTDTSAISYAAINVAFGDAHEFEFSFDYKVEGEEDYDYDYDGYYYYGVDYLKVYIMPVDATLSPTALPSYSSYNAATGEIYDISNWTNSTTILDSTYANSVKKIVFAWKNNSSDGSQPPAAIDNIRIKAIACSNVTNLAAVPQSGSESAEAQISFTNPNSGETNFILEYRPVGATQWTAIEISENPYTLQGLNYATKYECRVTALCGSDTSMVSSIATFKTPCAELGLPFEENFNATFESNTGYGTSPLCWFNIHGGSSYSSTWIRSTYYTSEGAGSLSASSGSTSYTYDEWMISPVIELNGNQRITFKARASSEPATVSIYALDENTNPFTAAGDTTNFELVENVTITGTTFDKYEVELPTELTSFRFAFVVNQVTKGFYIDEVKVSDIPTCPDVFGFTAELNGTNSASINLNTDNGSAWRIVYGTSENNLDQEVSISSAEDFPYTIENLEHLTTYYFAVQQDCGSEQGELSDIKSLTTLSTAVELPYIQNFDDPDGMEEIMINNGADTNKWYYGTLLNNTTDEDGNPTEGGAMYVSNDNGVSNNYTINKASYTSFSSIIQFGEGAGFTLSFDWKCEGESGYDYVAAYVLPLGADISTLPTENLISGKLAGMNTWQHAEFALGAEYANTLKRLVFVWRNDSSGGNGNAGAIDNVKLEVTTCAMPQSFTVSTFDNGTNVDATLTINDVAETGSYVIEYKTASEQTWTRVETPLTDPYTINGLNYGTIYSVRIASYCGEEDMSLFTAPVSVTTPCEPIPVPWTEEFNVAPNAICWTKATVLLTDTAIVQSSSFEPNSSWLHNTTTSIDGVTTGKMRNNVYGTSKKDWLITPSIDLGDGSDTYQIAFDVALTRNATNTTPNTDTAVDDRFAILVSLDNGHTWSSDNALIFANNDEDTEHNFSDLTNSFQRVIYKLVDSENNNINGVVKFAFYVESTIANGDNDLYIDNIEVSEWSSCEPATNVAVSSIFASSAEVSWEGTASSYLVSYKTQDATEWETETVTSSPFTLTGLQPLTNYQLKVQSICGEDHSTSLRTISFATPMETETIPYTCNFDAAGNNGWLLKNGTCTNKWHVGTPTGATSGALYISNDNGTTASYAVGSASTVVAEKLFETGTSDSLTISFDLTIGGETNATGAYVYDYLKVFWVPADTVYEASTSTTYYGDAAFSTNVIMSNATSASNYTVNLLTGTQTMSATIANQPNTLKKLVFVWRNDSSGGIQPGAIIDNLSIEETGGDTPAPCDAPTALTASNVTQTEATVSWTGTASSYEVRLAGGTAETVTTTSKTFTGLTAGTAYTVEVRAVCESSQSTWISTSFTTQNAQGVTAPTVTTLAATSVTHEAATLNGTITAGSEAITAQGFMYKATTATDWTTVSATGTTLTATVNNLTAETVYEYKAFATTASGTVEGTVMNFTTAAAPVVAPTVTTLAATSVTHEAATLNGTITVGSEAITAQGFMYKATTATEWTTVSATGTTLTATVDNLTAETAYEYKAFATTASGTVEGQVMNFTTLAASGLADIESGISAIIYPNPAKDKATLRLSGLTTTAKVIISDLQGRIIQTDEIQAGVETYELNTSNYASGVYYIRIVSGDKVNTQKLIVE